MTRLILTSNKDDKQWISNIQIRYIIFKEAKDDYDFKDRYEVAYEGDGSLYNTHPYMGVAWYTEDELPEEERAFYNFQERIKNKYPWNYVRIITNLDGTIKVIVKEKGANSKTKMSVNGSRSDVLKKLEIE